VEAAGPRIIRRVYQNRDLRSRGPVAYAAYAGGGTEPWSVVSLRFARPASRPDRLDPALLPAEIG